MRISNLTADAWTLPLLAPFQVAKRTALSANNIIVRLSAGSVTGVGACSPVLYVTGETIEGAISTIRGCADAMVIQDASDLNLMLAVAKEGCSGQPAALAGLELAIYDLWSKTVQIDLLEHFGGRATSVVTDMTVPIVGAQEAGDSAARLSLQGFDILKVKVGDPAGLDADIARVNAVLDNAPDIKLRIDANQGYTPSQAVEFVDYLVANKITIEFLEQPVIHSDHIGLRDVRQSCPFPIFADESVCSINDAKALIDLEAVDGIVVKLMKSGMSGAAEILKLCRDSGIKTMMGCMLETGIGISAAFALGAGSGADLYDLDSHRLLSPVKGLNVPFDCEDNRLVWHSGFYGLARFDPE